MKAIMYHYVRPFDIRLPFLKKLDFEDFKRQLDYLDECFGFVSYDDFISSLQTGLPAKGVVLTFDDGLKCHYNWVYPELKRRNLWGIFFVSTLPYHTNKILDVHRIHLLLGSIDSILVYERLLKIVGEEMMTDIGRREFRELTYNSQINDSYTVMVKRILNYYISYDFRERVLDQLMYDFIPTEMQDAMNFYITQDDLTEMNVGGMVIGSHTESHFVMSKLSAEKQKAEIVNSFKTLEDFKVLSCFRTFCYPYGGFHSFSDVTEMLLKEEGCVCSFNVEPRDVEGQDILGRPQALPRYDCNAFPYGSCK